MISTNFGENISGAIPWTGTPMVRERIIYESEQRAGEELSMRERAR